ncbi:MAG: TetR/AcrR family transcriptional regulator, partial [Reyranella sp.]
MAAKTYLEHHDIESLSLRHLAELAGVSPPTVYAHFRTVDDLVEAFFNWLSPRLGLRNPLPPLEQFGELPHKLFPNYEAYGALLRNLMNKPSWDRQRSADAEQRHGRWIAAVGQALPDLTPEQRRRGAMVVSAFWAPTLWRWLMDT